MCNQDVTKQNEEKHLLEECPGRQLDCSTCHNFYPAKDIEGHACRQPTTECPGCDETVADNIMPIHRGQLCSARLVLCRRCGQKVQQGSLEEHCETACTEKPRQCPYGCEEDVSPTYMYLHLENRKLMPVHLQKMQSQLQKAKEDGSLLGMRLSEAVGEPADEPDAENSRQEALEALLAHPEAFLRSPKGDLKEALAAKEISNGQAVKLGDVFFHGVTGLLPVNFREAYRFYCMADCQEGLYNQARMELYGYGCDQNEQAAFQKLKEAKEGSEPAMRMLAECYLNGYGCAPDRGKAKELLRSTKSLPEGQWELAQLLLEEENDEPALELIKVLATQIQFAPACVFMAQELLEESERIRNTSQKSKRQKRAYNSAKRAAAQMNPDGMQLLGELLIKGTGIRANVQKGVDMLEAAIRQEHPGAMDSLAGFLEEGTHVHRDVARAVRLLMRAASFGYTPAMYRLANTFLEGVLVPKSSTEAFKWFQRCAESDESDDALPLYFRELASCLQAGRGCDADLARAQQLLLQAAKRGDAVSMVELAKTYLSNKEEYKQDAPAAVALLKEASQAGSTDADLVLGNLYYHGLQVEQDLQRALNYYTRVPAPSAFLIRDYVEEIRRTLPQAREEESDDEEEGEGVIEIV